MFDLFNEVLTEADLVYFLHSHGIEMFRGRGLILRAFLLLVDLGRKLINQEGFGTPFYTVL